MSSTNLTHREAEARSALLQVTHYEVELHLGEKEPTFISRTRITFTVTHTGDTFLDLRARELRSVLLNGEDITPADYNPKAGIPLTGLSHGDYDIVVDAVCEYSRSGQGLHRFVDPADGNVYLYSQCQTADAKRIFACFDQPDLKATWSFRVFAPKHWQVILGGPTTITPMGAENRHECHIDVPLSTYLVAVCAGPYTRFEDTWVGELTHHPETPAGQPAPGEKITIPLAIYCRASLAQHCDADTLLEETKQGFDFYHRHFGIAYPFLKYDQLFVPEFNAGAMENAGAVTFRDEYIFSSKATSYRYERRNETLLHEMAHMWFGDMVTMRWWDDLWLNESFATWGSVVAQQEVSRYKQAWVTFCNVEKTWAYQQDQLPSTHPISTDASDIEMVEQNFDGITYAKGASVLKQLTAYVGQEAFLTGLRAYFARHLFGNAQFSDLLDALEEASGRDLSGWADQWLKTTGLNELAPEFTVGADGTYTSVQVRQTGALPGAGELRSHRIAVGLYRKEADGVVRRYRREEIDVYDELTDIPALVGETAADMVLVNDDDLTYCLMQLHPEQLSFVVDNISAIEDPLARTLCWSAAWEMTRSARMRARDFVRLVTHGAPKENQISVLERLLHQGITAVETYADPAWARDHGRQLLSEAYTEAAKSAEPGSDVQLAFMNALAGCNVSACPTAAGWLRALAEGTETLPGLVVDEELGWTLTIAAVSNGAYSLREAERSINERALATNSSVAKLSALRARYARNHPLYKSEAFETLTQNASTLSNLEIRHMLLGLTGTGSGPILGELALPYFDVAPSLWEKYSSDTAATLVEGLYPTWEVSEEALQRAEEFLSTGSHPAALARIVSECRARVERAWKNRQFDAS